MNVAVSGVFLRKASAKTSVRLNDDGQVESVYLVVSGGMVGQFLLKELTKRSVLSLQVKHQHLQLDALLSQILF